jgi:hypothetical protein
MKKLLLILAALPALCLGQTDPVPPCQQIPCYVATTGNVALTATATAATIQQPSAAPFNQVFGIKATVYCSVACPVTRSYGGSTATVTAGTVQKAPSVQKAPYLLFFTGSDSTGGTTVDVSNLAAGETRIFDLSDLRMGGQPNFNYTIAVGSITGTANITFYLGLQ